mmetsp:Transcript_23119/g.58079  ORF Transcript_23119/g.58079 Transcript_23119/m.58079 type:complete len:258 (-) Transcript_23119:121-894(-)
MVSGPLPLPAASSARCSSATSSRAAFTPCPRSGGNTCTASPTRATPPRPAAAGSCSLRRNLTSGNHEPGWEANWSAMLSSRALLQSMVGKFPSRYERRSAPSAKLLRPRLPAPTTRWRSALCGKKESRAPSRPFTIAITPLGATSPGTSSRSALKCFPVVTWGSVTGVNAGSRASRQRRTLEPAPSAPTTSGARSTRRCSAPSFSPDPSSSSTSTSQTPPAALLSFRPTKAQPKRTSTPCAWASAWSSSSRSPRWSQ